MLSHISHPPLNSEEEAAIDRCADISDNTFEVNFINTNLVDPKQFVSYVQNPPTDIQKPVFGQTEVNMSREQEKDTTLNKIKKQLRIHDPAKAMNKYVVLDDVLYNISDPDGEPVLR